MHSLAIQLENIYYAYNSFLLHLFYVLRSIFELRSWEISLDFVLLSELSMPLEGIRIAGLTAQGNGSCKCRWLMPDQCCQINWIDWAGGAALEKGKRKSERVPHAVAVGICMSQRSSPTAAAAEGAEVPQGVGQAAARYHGLNAFIKTQNAHSGSPKKKRCNSRPFAMSCSKCLSPLLPLRLPRPFCYPPLGVCISVCICQMGAWQCVLFSLYIPHTHTHWQHQVLWLRTGLFVSPTPPPVTLYLPPSPLLTVDTVILRTAAHSNQRL